MSGLRGRFDAERRRRELIEQVTTNQMVAVGKLAEAQSYAPARELLTDPRLGLGVPVQSVVIDAPVPFGRERPDIQVWLEGVPLALRNEGEHLYAILELKSGSRVADGGRAIARGELETYSYGKLRHFFLADARVVQRYDLDGGGLPEPLTVEWRFLADEASFLAFFSPLTPGRRTLREQLAAFSAIDVPIGRPIRSARDRRRFVDSIVTTARILNQAVGALVDARLVPDLRDALGAVARMEANYGVATFDFSADEAIAFAGEPPATNPAAHAAFNEAYTRLMAAVEDGLYALRAEKEILPAYAVRSGLDPGHASFLAVTSSNKDVRAVAVSARASFVQETSTLLFSRLLMIRFSEDNGLLPRVLSNGGLSSFSRFAEHVSDRFQSLVRTAYDKARPVYRHLFERKPLDWLLDGDDVHLSETLLHAMWIMAGWDFRTVRGDLLSGIYDRNLDPEQRRTLGEVYTRPELAQYMLGACGYDGAQKLLDPACGSGTFLVEAFEMARRRKEAVGVDFGADDVVETLGRLSGLDLNGFSATLAQIQLLWHVISGSQGDAVALMRRAIAALSIEGGHSSLETWGASMRDDDLFGGLGGRADAEVRAGAGPGRRRLKTADRRFRDMSVRRGGYDIVAGNPPFVRVGRVRLDEATKREYRDVRTKQCDLAVLFAYRATEWWLAEGGRLGFFLPLAISESAYAEPLRMVLGRYRILEIIDLEEIGNVAFHGARVVTMGLVIEKSPASEADVVRVTRVTPECLDAETGHIDMSRATSDDVPRSGLHLARYLPRVFPEAQVEPEDGEAQAGEGQDGADAGGHDAWLTKVRASDVPVLDAIAGSPRLQDLVLNGWKPASPSDRAPFAAAPPAGARAGAWRSAKVMGYGLKVGKRGMPEVAGGHPVFRAKHLPPDGTLLGVSAGSWDGDPALVDSVRFYAWDGVGDPGRAFAVRNISTQPVFAPHPPAVYLTNTVYCVRLRERFPLNVWSLSHVIAWFMAMTSRTSVVQDYFSTNYPRRTLLMPVPRVRDVALLDGLDDIGRRMFACDLELAGGERELEALRAGAGTKPLRNRLDLIADGWVGAPKSISWPAPGTDWSAATVVETENGVSFLVADPSGDAVPAPTLTGTPCHVPVRDPALRSWMAAEARRWIRAGRLPDRNWLQSLPVPEHVDDAVRLLERYRGAAALTELNAAWRELDLAVAHALGLGDDQLDHILAAFETDELLRSVVPQWVHRPRDLTGRG
ncbi:Eco57I restriction-modification methylase domain-containing protein [Lichenibacterium dinghuense]|uniref:Eco57I restriction-modification methylase domain-containing protein n=1 Tax=Lichenibacterium dinghuense TaxID=2895977 RepID=UPI001EFF86F5|nr:N-6 DNA methylase [Lichenibacterium sp. 6Y81]